MLACAVGAIFATKWGFGNSLAIRADLPEIAELSRDLAPGDPQAHFASAVLLEKSFEPADVEAALREYEAAASLSPNNYLLWLDLGRARERNGDRDGAESALRRASDLAPHYSQVQWALGNVLLRQGKTDEAFAQISKAAEGDPAFTGPAVSTAAQMFQGDLSTIRRTLGDSPRLNKALVALLATKGRLDEALEIWRSLPHPVKNALPNESGTLLLGKFVEAKRFRDAFVVSTDLAGATFEGYGKIANGGFEDPIKSQNAGIFEWQLGSGTQPQIASTTGQKHSGVNSLVMIFNAPDNREFRQVSQTIAVKPGSTYEFELYYRSDLKTQAVLRWEIANTADAQGIGSTEPLAHSTDWTPARTRFTVPDGTDGVVVRFTREKCDSIICTISGNLWFDDMSLKPVN